ncbi:MAG: 3-oxoacyl-[acyl-carrier-protein] reductase [Lachnospiraceae bacterium]|nr:3-oxoacyl-[acyl-carrier-protein] reductase [Lachnospiraceae bacterium]MEE1014940.1 3-oxoacyl-[acyl-carrier-protein] reductase [Lachnospiraceae bacterium]
MSERKAAIVTGASRGIGRATAVRLAKMGMDIVFTYNSGSEAAEETKALCEAEGARVLAVQADVSKSENCDELVAKTLEFCGRIDVLVNNAGITRDGLIIRMTDEQFDQVIDTNLNGAFYMMRAVSKQMMKQRCGRIINISSVVGVMGNAGQVNYAASKAGIIGMTKSLARELASRKVTVNAIAPGMIATDMTAVMSDKAKEAMKAAIPVGEMGKPEDIAAAVAFLASEDAGYITGQVICVDGGMAI